MNRISAKRSVTTSFVVDLLDIAINVTVMIITGSVILLAEALEGISDLIASSFLFIGLRKSKQRIDKKHPFGFGKALFFWTLISAIVLLVFGAGFSFYFGLQRFLHPHDIKHISFAYGALCISILTNGYSLSVSTRRLLDKHPLKEIRKVLIHSTHVETKNTFILDLTGASAAVIGMISLILYQITSIKHFDGLGGMMMGLIIAISAVVLIWGVKDYLVGKRASAEIEQQIRDIVLQVKQIKSILELNTMYLGSEKLLLHLDVHLDKSMTLEHAEKTVEKLKENLMKAIPIIRSVQVEIKTEN